MLNTKSLLFCAGTSLLMSLVFTACGDENTYVTKTGTVSVLESGEKLSKQACDSTNMGDMLFVTDSATAFMCDGKSWASLKGENGETGSDAAGCTAKSVKKDKRTGYELSCDNAVVDTIWNGEMGGNGSGCTAKSVKKGKRTGYEFTCGGAVVDTLWNGEKGDDGSICTAKSVKKDKRTGYELTCDNVVVDTLWNGAKGDNGSSCEIVDDASGVVLIICAKEESFDTTKVIKALCGATPYDPENKFCDIRDNQVYKMVTIGNQVWMAENLNYGDGDAMPNLNGSTWCGGSESDATNEDDCAKFGRLYTWAAAINMPESECGYYRTGFCNLGSGPIQGVCPDGWHLPDTTEWNALFTAVGGANTAGKMLKSTNGWNNNENESGNGEDSYGFTALSAGFFDSNSFGDKGYMAGFWSSVASTDDEASYFMELLWKDESADLNKYEQYNGFSVRCLKN